MQRTIVQSKINELELGSLEKSYLAQGEEELQRQYIKNGYIFMPGLLPNNLVNNFRSDCEELLRYIPDDLSERENYILKVKEDLLKSELYRQIIEHSVMYKISEILLGGTVSLVERKIIRCKPPFSRGTGAHIDQTYLRCGSGKCVTVWIPIGEVSLEMGALMYLENSSDFGKDLERIFEISLLSLNVKERSRYRENGMGKKGWLTEDLPGLASIMNRRWLSANYKSGDIVIHDPYIIHAALDNQDFSRTRVSTDVRFQLNREKGDHRWQKEWNSNDGL